MSNITAQLTGLRQNLKIHASREVSIGTEHIESTLVDHKNQREKSVENIAERITIMNDKIDQQQCSCNINNNMNRIEKLLINMQNQQTLDRHKMKPQVTELRNMNKLIPQSTPPSDAPRFHEDHFFNIFSPLQANYEHG